MVRRLAYALLVATLILSGCVAHRTSRQEQPVEAPQPAPAPAPDPTQPAPSVACVPGSTAVARPFQQVDGIPAQPGTPERPWIPQLSLRFIEEVPGGAALSGELQIVRSGAAVAGTGEVVLSAWLHPAPADAWQRTHVEVRGVEPIWPAEPSANLLELRIPPGQPGETFQVTLRNVLAQDGTPGDLVVTFCRQAAPTATLTYEAADGWREVRDYVAVQGDLKVRANFSAPMDRESTEQALRQFENEPLIRSFTWIDDQTVELQMAQPRPVMALNLLGARDEHGQTLVGGLPVLYVGDPAHLAAVDPRTAQERRLADLPPEVQSAAISPDGRQLLLQAITYRAGFYYQAEARNLVLDLQTKQTEALDRFIWFSSWVAADELVGYTPQPAGLALWRRTAAGVQVEPLQLNGALWHRISPDGRRLAAALPDDTIEMRDYYYPARIVVSAPDGTGRSAPSDLVWFYRPPKDGLKLFDAAWSPDGARIALTQPGPDESTRLVLVETQTGAARVVVNALPDLRAGWAPLSWSPDARQILVGPYLVDVADGTITEAVPGLWTEAVWSPDGAWILYEDGTEVKVTHLASHRTVSLGAGRPAGWTPAGEALIVRWDGFPYGWVPGI